MANLLEVFNGLDVSLLDTRDGLSTIFTSEHKASIHDASYAGEDSGINGVAVVIPSLNAGTWI
jgi:hypothetical protein